jgi:hypothetical protein
MDAANSASWFMDLDVVLDQPVSPAIWDTEEFPAILEAAAAPESACFTDLDEVLDRAPLCDNVDEFPEIHEESAAEPQCAGFDEILADDQRGVHSSWGQFGDHVEEVPLPLLLAGMEDAEAQSDISFRDWDEHEMAVDEEQQLQTWSSSQSRSGWEREAQPQAEAEAEAETGGGIGSDDLSVAWFVESLVNDMATIEEREAMQWECGRRMRERASHVACLPSPSHIDPSAHAVQRSLVGF